MLDKYNPLHNEYQALWRKLSEGKLAKGALKVPKIVTQEEAIKWSLALKSALKTKAIEHNVSAKALEEVFASSLHLETNNRTKTELGFNCVNLYIRIAQGNIEEDEDAQRTAEDIDRFGLFFDFNCLDDLFLGDSSKNCVYSIE